MKLYLMKTYNSSGGGIGNYHVVASGITAAKKAVKEFDNVATRVKCIEELQVIIATEDKE
jgi:hypothetical protein